MKIFIFFFLFCIPILIKGQIHLDINTCRRIVLERFEKITPDGINIHVSQNQNNNEWFNFLSRENICGLNYINKNQEKPSPLQWNQTSITGKNINYARVNPHSDIYLKNFPQNTDIYAQINDGKQLDNYSWEYYRKDALSKIQQVGLYSQEIDLLRRQYNIYEKIVEVDIAYWNLVYYSEMEFFIQKYKDQVSKELRNFKNENSKKSSNLHDIQKLQLKISNIEKVRNDIVTGKLMATHNLCLMLGFETTTSISVEDSLKSTFNSRIELLELVLPRRPEYNLYKKEYRFYEEMNYLQDSLKLSFKDVFGFYKSDNKLRKLEFDEELIWKTYNIYSNKPEYFYKNGRLQVYFDERKTKSINNYNIVKMIDEEIKEASSNLKDAQRRVNTTYSLKNDAQEKMEQSALKWKDGHSDIDPYIENQSIWYYSWSDWVNAKKELKIYETYYLRALGKLLIDI